MTFLFFPKHKSNSAKWLRLLLPAAMVSCLMLLHCRALDSRVSTETITTADAPSVIRVNVTRQNYNFHRPWQQRASSTHTGIGVVIQGQGPRILVTSQFMANHRYIELEKVNSGEKSRAELEVVDYEANLALLKPSDPQFLKNSRPLELITDAVQGDQLAVWQIKPNGIVTPAVGTITAIEPTQYPYRNYFLAYRLNSSLQYRSNNFTLPVIKDGKLAGLLMSDNAKVQTIDVVAAPVIAHFLEDNSDGEYQGFPLAGIMFSSTKDPQLRRYVGIADKTGGVYVESVTRGSPAEKAGIQKGDIVFEISGFFIDSRGNYDHPVYGKMALSHLTRCEFHVGDTITYKIFRKGKDMVTDIVLGHRPPEAYLVPPYIIDKPPRYYILGGLVFQELSGSYLKEYGSRWQMKAPVDLVYYEAFQDALEMNGREKIVFLSSLLPTSYTVGYDTLSNTVVNRINNQTITRLEDIPRALETPIDGFHRIEFEHRPKVIYLDPREIPKINNQIQKRYALPALSNLEQ
ncbi:MAG: PDZ domain-containing protein [Deltaproteobacteria bacterium]|nr:PDZ domain-containing protein [Deltaproteobacteria bacterium]